MKRNFKGGSASDVASCWIVIAHISFNISATNHYTQLFYFNHFQPLSRWLKSLKNYLKKSLWTPQSAGDETSFLWNQNQWIHHSTKCVGGGKSVHLLAHFEKDKSRRSNHLPLYNTFPSFTSHQISKRANKAFGIVWVCKLSM